MRVTIRDTSTTEAKQIAARVSDMLDGYHMLRLSAHKGKDKTSIIEMEFSAREGV